MAYDTSVTGKVIRRLRKERGLSRDVLSGLAGIGRSHLAMIEIGTKCANMETLWRIAEALDMKLSELIALAEQEMPS